MAYMGKESKKKKREREQIHVYVELIPAGFPAGSDGKASTCNLGDPDSILGWEDPLEKETATHSSTLAWEIPWTEEPGRLQSMVAKSQT